MQQMSMPIAGLQKIHTLCPPPENELVLEAGFGTTDAVGPIVHRLAETRGSLPA